MKAVHNPAAGKMRVACLLSGTGSTARAICEHAKRNPHAGYEVVCLFSDTADEEKCSIRKIAEEFKLPCSVRDIGEFYRSHGHSNKKDMQLREQFDALTAQWLAQNNVQVVALAGYMSLVTAPIWKAFVTLNSHPADLARRGEDGRRKYVGAHATYDSIRGGEREIKASIIVVNEGVDAGPLLMRSRSVSVPPIEGKSDEHIRAIARDVQNELKKEGDIPAYCTALAWMARGLITLDGAQARIRGALMPQGFDLGAPKQEFRRTMLAARRAMDGSDVQELSGNIQQRALSLPVVKNAARIMAYVPMKNEVQTQQILAEKKEVFVPKMTGGDAIVAVRHGNEDALQDAKGLDVIFVPGIAFDRRGFRLGYGRGCYDRFLAGTQATKIGLAYDAQVFDEVPSEAHDVQMNFVVTQTQVIQC